MFAPFDALVLRWNLLSFRSIRSAPVRGGTHFLCTRFYAGAWGRCLFKPFDAPGLPWNLPSSRSIRSAPVRGGTHFLCCCKESKQRKQLPTAKANQPPLAFDWDRRWRVSVALTIEPGLARGPTASTRTSSEWYALRLAPSSLCSDVGFTRGFAKAILCLHSYPPRCPARCTPRPSA